MSKRRNDRFQRGSGIYVCRICGKRTRETGGDESNVELCFSCFEEAGLENEHSDYGHDEPVDGCPTCRAEPWGEGRELNVTAGAVMMRATGMTYAKIAEELGVSPATAWRRVHEARS